MKYIKNFNENLENDDSNNDENLKNFHKKLMNDIKSYQQRDNDYNFIDKNMTEIKELFNKYLFTPKFRAGVLERYKVEVPTRIYFGKKIVPKTKYHYHMKWQVVDSIIPSEQHFILLLEVEIPIDEEFREDNTMCSINLYIKPKNRRKDFGELYNRRITKDGEGNFLQLASMIKSFGEDMNKHFEIPVKLSKKHIN